MGPRRNKGTLRLAATVALGVLGLAGCGGNSITEKLTRMLPDSTPYRYAAIVADDSTAVVAAQDIISRGGTAADAAVALYFTLAVTMPSVASLGGGGTCLVHDPKRKRTEMLDFIAPQPASGVANGDRPSAVPGNVRGMAVLHSRYGRLPWRDLLAKAEDLARRGVMLSRPTAADLKRAAGPLFADETARSVFATDGGAAHAEGDVVRQVDLGATLGQIRARGAGAFYTGTLADRVVAGVVRAGGTLTKEDLRSMVPRWRTAPSVDFEKGRLYVAAAPALGGVTAAEMWQMLVTDSRYAKAPAEERMHLLAEVSRRALQDRGAWLALNGNADAEAQQMLSSEHARSLMRNYDPDAATPVSAFAGKSAGEMENPSGTGFVVVDGTGLAVACTVTLYNPFGTGRLVPGIGMFLAQAPGVGSRNPYSLGPVMATGPDGEVFRFAAAGAGGGAVAPAIVSVAARTLLDGEPLADAMKGGRVYASPASTSVFVESAETVPRVETLARRGYDVRRLGTLGKINVVYCASGLPIDQLRYAKCSPETDTPGEGLGVTVLLQQQQE
jgi:gamma-glutamyltranspeptidase / glutathione hydrolase